MRLHKFKKRVEIDKTIGNVRIATFHYSVPKGEGWKKWTELHCWYKCDFEHCPASWSDWYGEDGDCGCYLAKLGEDYAPLWKCMLPKWAKRLFVKIIFAITERRYANMEKTMRLEEEEE